MGKSRNKFITKVNQSSSPFQDDEEARSTGKRKGENELEIMENLKKKRKIEKLKKKFDSLKEDVDSLKEDVDSLKVDVEDLHAIFTSLKELAKKPAPVKDVINIPD